MGYVKVVFECPLFDFVSDHAVIVLGVFSKSISCGTSGCGMVGVDDHAEFIVEGMPATDGVVAVPRTVLVSGDSMPSSSALISSFVRCGELDDDEIGGVLMLDHSSSETSLPSQRMGDQRGSLG